MPAFRCLWTSKANQASYRIGLLVLSLYTKEAREHDYWTLERPLLFVKQLPTEITDSSNIARKPRQNEMA